MRDIWKVDQTQNGGIFLHFSKDIDSDLKAFIQAFVRWIRKKYCFPIKLSVTIQEGDYVINSLTGEHVAASIFLPFDKKYLPEAQISTGAYRNLEGDDLYNAKCSILVSMAHEITHYFQWVKDETGRGELSEKQADYKAKQIVFRYIDTQL